MKSGQYGWGAARKYYRLTDRSKTLGQLELRDYRAATPTAAPAQQISSGGEKHRPPTALDSSKPDNESNLRTSSAAGYRPTATAGVAPQTVRAPVYDVVEHLKKQVATTLEPGDKIPGYNQIRTTFSVSMMTVSRAVARLIEENILMRRSEKCVVVANSPEFAALREKIN